MNPSEIAKLDADADQMIQNMQTAGETPAEPVGGTQAGAEAQTEQVEQNTDQGVSTEGTAADTQPQNTDEINRLTTELEKSEQRYKSLMGMINKRDGENESLRQLVSQLTRQVTELSSAPQQPQAAKPQSLITDKDKQEYGDDMVDLIQRAAREIVEREMGNFRGQVGEKLGRIDEQVETVAHVTAQTAQHRFDAELAAQVPDWQSINLDPAFTAYLEDNDWLQPLNDAYSRTDLAKVVKYFNKYKAATGKTTQATNTAPVADVKQFVAPGKSKSIAPPSATTGKIWSPADINKLYDDQANGKISNEEFNRQEADLFKAQREGRYAA